MSGGLAAGLVQVLQRRAREFELAGGLQRHRGAVLFQRDQVTAFQHRGPAELGQTLEHGADALRPLIRRRAQVGEAEAELLVLGADAPVFGRLVAGSEVVDELLLGFDP